LASSQFQCSTQTRDLRMLHCLVLHQVAHLTKGRVSLLRQSFDSGIDILSEVICTQVTVGVPLVRVAIAIVDAVDLNLAQRLPGLRLSYPQHSLLGKSARICTLVRRLNACRTRPAAYWAGHSRRYTRMAW
jgi:hypothetical protein